MVGGCYIALRVCTCPSREELADVEPFSPSIDGHHSILTLRLENTYKYLGLQVGRDSRQSPEDQVNHTRRKYVEPFSPSIDDQHSIPALRWEGTYKYLGLQVGRDSRQSRESPEDQVDRALLDTEKITSSLLAEWQKLDAIKSFIIPRFTHLLDTPTFPIKSAEKLDSGIRRLMKKALRLPKRTTTPFFYVSSNKGGLGLPSILDLLHCARVTRAVRCLASSDKLVNDISWSQLHSTVKTRWRLQDPQAADLTSFINNPPRSQEARARGTQSLWSTLRKDLQFLQASLVLDGTRVSVTIGECNIGCQQKKLRNALKAQCELKHLDSLLAAEDQGRAFHATSLDPASSSWIPTGQYMSFADYRFALRARLNLLPTKSVAKRARRLDNDICPKCTSAPETLAHVLNACTPNAGLMGE